MNNKKAFSLIELSIVLLIIGIIIAGITQSSRMIGAFRLQSARSITQSSPVSSIRDLALWLETTSENSFDSGVDNGTAISSGAGYVWKENNPQLTIKNTASSTSGPVYTNNCINNLPCLRFNGSSHYLNTTQSLGTTSALSVFLVFRASTLGVLQDFMVTRGSFSANDMSFTMTISNIDNKIYYRSTKSGATNAYSTDALTVSRAYVSNFIDTGTAVTQYLSSNATPTSTTTDNGTKSLATLTIGAWDNTSTRTEYFAGDIGEIIIFTRALKSEERVAIQTYLGKKWGITIN